MRADIRGTAIYREVNHFYNDVRRPGSRQLSDGAEVRVSADGLSAVFSGTLIDQLQGTPPTRICKIDLSSAEVTVLTCGPNIDRSPCYSPDGRTIAFLSDRHRSGDFQLYLLDAMTSAVTAMPHMDGWVEYLRWSPNGRSILIGVAGHGADAAGGQGAIASRCQRDNEGGAQPSWIPKIETGAELHRWRHISVLDLDTARLRRVSQLGVNVWEAGWAGDEAIAAVSSNGPAEGLWYGADLRIFSLANDSSRTVFKPEDQLGCVSSAASGRLIFIVEAVCSDRCIVAGDARLIDVRSGKTRYLDTHGVDVSYGEWLCERLILLAGHRGLQTVIGVYDSVADTFEESWASADLSTGGFYVSVSALKETGDCVLIGESFTVAPEVAVIRRGQYKPVRSFDLGYADHAAAIDGIERVTWSAPDGLDLEGWLLRPRSRAPVPLVMGVHGGPVWHWRPLWLGRRSAALMMLIERGYAVFLPNPRGSSGRGQAFVRPIRGDVGGLDAIDLLAGIDYLIDRGIADAQALGVTGLSYGGYMTSWLVTQDSRFAAAVSVSPMTNYVTQQLISNIPHFVKLFLLDEYTDLQGRCFQRSPVMHAHKARTPILNICGLLDRCTPPEEAVQFHNALLANGVKSVLVTYPEEGHGVSTFPASIDFSARLLEWFEQHMPPRASK